MVTFFFFNCIEKFNNIQSAYVYKIMDDGMNHNFSQDKNIDSQITTSLDSSKEIKTIISDSNLNIQKSSINQTPNQTEIADLFQSIKKRNNSHINELKENIKKSFLSYQKNTNR